MNFTLILLESGQYFHLHVVTCRLINQIDQPRLLSVNVRFSDFTHAT